MFISGKYCSFITVFLMICLSNNTAYSYPGDGMDVSS